METIQTILLLIIYLKFVLRWENWVLTENIFIQKIYLSG